MSCTWSRRRKDSGKAILARPWPGLSQLKLYIPMHSICNTRLTYWNAMLRIMRRQQSVSVLCEYTIAHLFQLLYLLLFQSHQFPESTYGAVAGDQLPNKCPQKWEWNYAGTRVLCKNVQAPNSGGTAQHIHAHHQPQYLNFRYLDTKYRVTFVNVCTAVYNVLMSYMKHDFGVHLPLEEKLVESSEQNLLPQSSTTNPEAQKAV